MTNALSVLANYDLLDIILDFFDPYEKQALLWVALTSKSFLKPGLDKLWQQMNSLWPLYWLLALPDSRLPVDAIYDRPFERVLMYARRIRVLRLDAEADSSFSDLQFYQVIDRANELDGFHSLRHLRIHSECTTDLFPFSAPNLEVVEFLTYPKQLPDVSSSSFLRATAFESPALKALNIYTDTFSTTTFDALPCFSNLQHLKMNITDSDVSISFLRSCSTSMTSLQSLTMCFIRLRIVDNVDQPLSVDASTISRYSSTFHLLSKLDVAGTSKTIQVVLNVLRLPSLEILRLSFCGYDVVDIKRYVQHFMALHGHLKNKLHSLHLQAPRSLKIDFISCLQPFKTLARLNTLHIDSGVLIPTSTLTTLDFRDNQFLSNLTSLRLAYSDSNGVSNTLSIAALPLLADLCPKLLHLTIAIYDPDQTAMRHKTTRTGDKAPIDHADGGSHNLETLAFCWTPLAWDYSVSLAFTFSAFLRHLFPRVNSVAYSLDAGYHTLGSRTQWMSFVQETLRNRQRNEITGVVSQRPIPT